MTARLVPRGPLKDFAAGLARWSEELTGDIEKARGRGFVALARDLARLQERVSDTAGRIEEFLDDGATTSPPSGGRGDG